MKTIHDLADNLMPSKYCWSDNGETTLYTRAQMVEFFETGANYVLEEIENVIKSDRILGHPFPSFEMRYNQIISVIEQLKK